MLNLSCSNIDTSFLIKLAGALRMLFQGNEVVVRKPEEALKCFLRTNMDVLLLGNFVVKRK